MAKRKSNEVLEWSHGLNLTYDELAGIGAVVASWAHADRHLRFLVESLSADVRNEGNEWKGQKLLEYQRLQRAWRKLSGAVFEGHSLHQEANEFLLNEGYRLKKQRDLVAHWVAAKPAKSEGIEFSNLTSMWWDIEDVQIEEPINFTHAELFDLAESINRWRADLFCLEKSIHHDTHIPKTVFGAGEYGDLVRDLYSRRTSGQNPQTSTTQKSQKPV